MSRCLAETTNLLKLHEHVVGQSEVPPVFHLWAMLSAIAATVANHVWTPFQGDRLSPNIFTLLIGGSASGKGKATKSVLPYLPPGVGRMGPITGQGLMQLLARESRQNGGARPFLIMEELAHCVGDGKQALDFIRVMTGMWEPRVGDTVKETVTNKRATIHGHCINFLGGTTRNWFTDVIRVEDLPAGPGRRFLVVEGERDPAVRIPDIIFPPDKNEVIDFIIQVFTLLATEVEGEITKTPAAKALENAWYLTREAPTSEDELPLFYQVHENANKLAILCALADGAGLGSPMEGGIRMVHMQAAIAFAEYTYNVMRLLLDISGGKNITELRRLRRIIARRGVIPYWKALKESQMMRREFEEGIQTLRSHKEINVKVVDHPTRPTEKVRVIEWRTPRQREDD